MSIKIAMIGAGSIGFTRKLMHDILAVPELADTTFAMMDISEHNLDMVEQLCVRDIPRQQLARHYRHHHRPPRRHPRRRLCH